ncbi:type II secretion system protein GspC [Marinimicrobium alkaliphilum]|uniref:type II secretion system protein GspC n=1 Tax=Marinimicrobium alkaliphilum TaxID=2202654 RepID=UPI001300905B|nr:type II secretion system protein GspC [Marinimicrobium alkaliphilum]
MANTHEQNKPALGAKALDLRAERLEQMAQRVGAALARVPVGVWRFLIIFLLVLWLSHSLARLFWLVVPVPELPQASVSANALATDRGGVASAPVDIDRIKNLQIFGRADEAAIAAQEEEEAARQQAHAPGIEDDAVDTELNLKLHGAFGSGDDASAAAIIARGSSQAIYRVGDELPVGRNVTLAKVLARRVILDNNGRYESLWLFTEGDFARRDARLPADLPAASRAWEGDDEQLDEPYVDDSVEEDQAAMGPEEEPTEVSVSADELASAAGQSLTDVVSMSIHREGGQIVGYRIRPGRNAELFESLGLQSDDIVTAVNGVPLDSAGRIMEISRDMNDATSATLDIRRGGDQMSIDIVLQ